MPEEENAGTPAEQPERDELIAALKHQNELLEKQLAETTKANAAMLDALKVIKARTAQHGTAGRSKVDLRRIK